MPNKDEIKVRYGNGTYVARCQGKTARCTAGAKRAAEAVAKKIMGACPHSVARVDGDALWKIVVSNN